jgi:hypothetical protein
LIHDPQYRLSVAWQNVVYRFVVQPWEDAFRLGKMEVDPVAGFKLARRNLRQGNGAIAVNSAQTLIRFTSVSPELKVWVQLTAARLAHAQA